MNLERPPFERPLRPGQEPSDVSGRRRFNPLLIFGIPLFAVAALYVLLVVATMADDIFFPGNELPIPNISPFEKDDPEVADINERINILFLGLDRRVGVPEETAARTDSVFVFTIDPYSKTAGVFSIPRDLVVEIPDGSGGYIENRVNVAWEYGEFIYEDYPDGGPGLAIDTIEHNFDIPIDHYVILDFGDFKDLIDEVGGIDIDVPEYEADYDYSDCEGCPGYPVEFFPGPQHMDADTALAYARIRKSSNDFKRIERQHLVIEATAKKALSLNLSVKALDLYKKYKDAVQTDISDLLIPGLAKLAKQVGTDNITMVSIGSTTYPCTTCAGSMLLADWDKVEELKEQVFGDGKIQAEEALVELQNGTKEPDRAEQFASFLRGHGIPSDLLIVGDADTTYSRSLIVDRTGKEYTAEKLAEWLNLPTDRIVSATDSEASAFAQATGDIVVVLGSDASLSTAAIPSGE